MREKAAAPRNPAQAFQVISAAERHPDATRVNTVSGYEAGLR
jgi:hypothetical protein